MKKTMLSYLCATTLIATMLLGTSCKKDYTDPSNPTEDKVFNSPTGMTNVCIGLQRWYTLGRASNLYNTVTTTAMVTREMRLLNPGNLPEFQLSQGGATVDGTNTMLGGLWSSSNKIIYDADRVLENAPKLADKSYAAGLVGYASLFKALALGNLSMYWEQVPDGIGTAVKFMPRSAGYDRAVSVIDNALSTLQANPPTSSFTSLLPPGLELSNTLQALKARYLVLNGKYAQALVAANLVDLNRRSTFNFEAANPNTLFDVHASNFNNCQPVDSTMGLPVSLAPALADQRVPFYMAVTTSTASRFALRGFATTAATAFPIFLPGEITLIKAECLARQATPDLNGAIAELNKVVTKTATQDIYGVGAALPALPNTLTQTQVLDEIYKNRCIELYVSGLKLEDMRRFGRPNAERTRNFMPYPFRERDNNPNTPPDPAF